MPSMPAVVTPALSQTFVFATHLLLLNETMTNDSNNRIQGKESGRKKCRRCRDHLCISALEPLPLLGGSDQGFGS